MATDNKERYLKQIADELHQMNKVLDRMCQAPMFDLPYRLIHNVNDLVEKDSQE